jgi:hypothetical protein
VATFLDLVKDLARQSSTLAGGPASITTLLNATGRLDKLADWVRKAWIKIQNDRNDWPWMRAEFTSPLIIGQARYMPVDLGISTRFGQWAKDRPGFCVLTLYDPTIGQPDQHEIRQRDYDWWRMHYARGVTDPNRPTDWAVGFDNKLCVGATPDKAYVLAGEYRRSAQILVADADVPECPEEYHLAIIWEAMKLAGIASENQVGAANAVNEFEIARDNLYRDFLPEITIGGGSLA